MRAIAVPGFLALAACSSFETAPATPEPDAAVATTPASDAGVPVDVPAPDAGPDAGTEVVPAIYAEGFEGASNPWTASAADVGSVIGRNGKGISVCGNGAGKLNGSFTVGSNRAAATRPAGHYRARVAVRNANAPGSPLITASLRVPVYLSPGDTTPVPGVNAMQLDATVEWQVLVQDFDLQQGQVPALLVTATFAPRADTACIRLDDASINRIE